jgi:alpha-mannosidase
MTTSTFNVHVVSHTHWDREWYQTREEYRARLVDLVDGVLDRMAADSEFTYFHLDGQTIVLEDYLEVRPDREPEIRRRVEDGRLLVGPWYVMPDMFLVSGESIVRNLALGMRIAAEFGGVMRVGYMPDPFGHVAQMPQILAGFGLEGAILWRGLGGERAEYAWHSPDGTRALLLHLPRDGYCNGLRLPLLDPAAMAAAAAKVVAVERRRSSSRHALLMVGVDHVSPHPALLRVVDVVGTLPQTTAALSTLPAYVAAVRSEPLPDLEHVEGELRAGENYAHLLPGVLSARMYLKQANARVQRELERRAEPLSVFAAIAGAAPDARFLEYGWKTLLQNHPHDSICGCSIDAVHEENVTRFERARQAAAIAGARAAKALAARLPPASPHTLGAVVVNSERTSWSGIVETTIDIPMEIARSEADVDCAMLDERVELYGRHVTVTGIVTASGDAVPFEILDSRDEVSLRTGRYAPPVAIHVRRQALALRLNDVPPLGYSTIVVHVGGEGAAATTHVAAEASIENELIRVAARDDGSVDVVDKRGGAAYRAFAIEDTGDVGDEYNNAPPRFDCRITNADARDVVAESTHNGTLAARMTITYRLPVPAAAAEDRQSRATQQADLPVALDISLCAGSPMVRANVRVDNRAKDHRLRLLCDTGTRHVIAHRADSAFAVVERPRPKAVPPGPLMETVVEAAPMQSVVDAGDRSIGAMVVADGLPEYEIVDTESGCSIAVTLLRAVGDLSRDDFSTRRGHAGPGLATPGAQCSGPHEFRLAFVPRTAAPSAGEMLRISREFLAPPSVYQTAGGDGTLPASRSFLQIDGSADVVLSACKLSQNGEGIIVRVFNAGGTADAVTISAASPIRRAFFTDLAENRVREAPPAGKRVVFSLGPHRIETIEMIFD